MIKADPSDMYGMIAGYPKQFAKGFRLAEAIELSPDIDNLVVAGMGGSASSPDITLSLFQEQIKVPYTVHRSYGIPHTVSPKTLFVAISFSGNTEETIDAFHQAYAQGAQIVVVASGGELSHLAQERRLPLVTLPIDSEDFQPRMAGGYNVGVLTQLLINACLIPESSKDLVLTAATALDGMYLVQQGKKVAEMLKGFVPIIYAPDEHWAVARVSKIKICENSKIPCFWHVVPEMNHTEMVGFMQVGQVKYFVLMLDDPESDPRIRKRFDALKQLLAEHSVDSAILTMPGTNRAERTLGTLMLMDWVSYWLALAMGIDPTPVALVETFKATMKN